MGSAIRSFFLLTTVALMSVFVIWGYLRSKGELAAVHQPLKHPFLSLAPTAAPDLVAFHATDDIGLHGTVAERFAQLAEQDQGLAFWLDLSRNSTGVYQVDETSTSLSDVLQALSGRRLILNFHGYQPGMLEEIAGLLLTQKQNIAERVLIQSPEDGLLKDLRQAQPLWLFGSSQAQVTRLVMLASIGLETSVKLPGDVFVLQSENPEAHELSRLSDSMIQEVHRRGMKIYAGPVSAEEIESLYHRGIDGILTRQPKEYRSRTTLKVAPESRTH